jgi:hypothetical protein
LTTPVRAVASPQVDELRDETHPHNQIASSGIGSDAQGLLVDDTTATGESDGFARDQRDGLNWDHLVAG